MVKMVRLLSTLFTIIGPLYGQKKWQHQSNQPSCNSIGSQATAIGIEKQKHEHSELYANLFKSKGLFLLQGKLKHQDGLLSVTRQD